MSNRYNGNAGSVQFKFWMSNQKTEILDEKSKKKFSMSNHYIQRIFQMSNQYNRNAEWVISTTLNSGWVKTFKTQSTDAAHMQKSQEQNRF